LKATDELALAAEEGDLATVQTCLEKGANVEMPSGVSAKTNNTRLRELRKLYFVKEKYCTVLP